MPEDVKIHGMSVILFMLLVSLTLVDVIRVGAKKF